MTRWSKFPKHLLTYAVLLGVHRSHRTGIRFGTHGRSAENGNRTAKVLSVRKCCLNNTSSAAIPGSTITCCTFRSAFPMKPIAPSMKLRS